MARYTECFDENGGREQRLEFKGKTYICRTSPFEDGIAHGLDIDLDRQVEKDFPQNEELLELVYNLSDMGGGDTILPKLTYIENII